MRNAVIFSALVLASLSLVEALLPQFGKIGGAAAKSNVFADEAIAVFSKKFPFDREPLKPSAFLSIGMPGTDIDGTEYTVYKKGESRGKRLTDISEQQARATFNELAKLYGGEDALTMTKALPVCLSFNKDRFALSLKEYVQIFGEDDAKAMVVRNPGLLAVPPVEAARATDQTMQASYVIGFTRPYGPVLLPGLLALLLVPAFEGVSGIPIRAAIFAAITGSS